MRIGLEVSIVKDTASGKRGLRVMPYLHATPEQTRLIAYAVAVGLLIGSLILLTYVAPDPIIAPTTVLIP